MKKVIIGVLLLASCNDLFDTHPYDINFADDLLLNKLKVLDESPAI